MNKRLTVTRAALNPEFEADSFAVSGELAAAYHETATRPMHDVPLDSVRVEGDFVRFGAFGSPAGAVKIGDGWLLLETGQARLSIDRATTWLEQNAPGRLRGAVVTALWGNGGSATLVERGAPVLTGRGIAPHLEGVARGAGDSVSPVFGLAAAADEPMRIRPTEPAPGGRRSAVAHPVAAAV